MMFECFVEGKGVPFLSNGRTRKAARQRAEEFLDHLALPVEGLVLKRHLRTKIKKGNQKKKAK